jgi:CRP-like cAMP-binding protein
MIDTNQDEFKALKKFVEQWMVMPEEGWNVVIPLLTIRHLKKGEFFVRAGEQRREVGFVVRGLIRKYYSDDEGSDFTTALLSEGRLAAPYEFLLSNQPNEASLQAIEDTSLVVFNYDQFQEFAQNHILWKEIALKVAQFIVLERERRQVRLVMASATERYEDFLREHANLVGRVANYQIASYLGITPEALSRLLRARGKS